MQLIIEQAREQLKDRQAYRNTLLQRISESEAKLSKTVDEISALKALIAAE